MICRLASIIDQKNLSLSESGQATKRLNQSKISEDTGIAKTTVNRLFNNDFDRVDKKTVETLCNYFDCDVGDLFSMREVDE